jgi:hypothetical protein
LANDVTLLDATDATGVLPALLKLCEKENLPRLHTASLLMRRCTSGAVSCAPKGKLLLSLRAMGKLGLFAGGLDAQAAEEGLELNCTLYTMLQLTVTFLSCVLRLLAAERACCLCETFAGLCNTQ